MFSESELLRLKFGTETSKLLDFLKGKDQILQLLLDPSEGLEESPAQVVTRSELFCSVRIQNSSTSLFLQLKVSTKSLETKTETLETKVYFTLSQIITEYDPRVISQIKTSCYSTDIWSI